MTRLHFVKRARKTYRGTGIKKGASYWWWKFYRGIKHRSTKKPRSSQLTQSAFWSGLYSSTESFDDAVTNATTMEEFKQAVTTLQEALDEIKTETEEKKENMPESLQEGSTGELLQERIDGLEEFISELEGLDIPDEEESEEENPDAENSLETTRAELQSLSGYTGS